jgi:hypothetical protein
MFKKSKQDAILVQPEFRNDDLIRFGAPAQFVKNIGRINLLGARVENTDAAYFYIPMILNYQILQGKHVVPIYCEGESFYVLVHSGGEGRIIFFELENDEVCRDYSLNWGLLQMDILFQYFDDNADKGVDSEVFLEIAQQLGFEKGVELYKQLNISDEEYNLKFPELENWKDEIARSLRII